MLTLGLPIIISAPSGCGKTTIIKKLLQRNDSQMSYSVSTTTRSKRKGEREGADYYFITENSFRDLIEKGEFLEWAIVFGNYYGTKKNDVLNLLKVGKDIILEIDVQGAATLRLALSEPVSIFILPPSIKELRERLESRATDDKKTVEKRLAEAKKEIKEAHKFDYVVVNHDPLQAVKEIEAILIAEKNKVIRNKEEINELYIN